MHGKTTEFPRTSGNSLYTDQGKESRNQLPVYTDPGLTVIFALYVIPYLLFCNILMN